jgi:hypothetical protein
LTEPTSQIQTITASRHFAVLQVSYGPYNMFGTDGVFYINK